MAKKPIITPLSQVLSDFTLKDSIRYYSLTYSYAANQLGHFALGFISVSLIYFLAKINLEEAIIYTTGFWLLFETYLLYNTLQKIKSEASNQTYNIKLNFVLLDIIVDLGFFVLGIFFLLILLKNNFYQTKYQYCRYGYLCLLSLLLIHFRKIWLRKLRLTNAYLGDFSALGFSKMVAKSNYTQLQLPIINFINNIKTNEINLVIFGKPNLQKTNLAKSILEELSKNNVVFYTTFTELKILLLDQITSRKKTLMNQSDVVLVDGCLSEIKTFKDDEKSFQFLNTSFYDKITKIDDYDINDENKDAISRDINNFLKKNLILVFTHFRFNDCDKNIYAEIVLKSNLQNKM